VHILFELDFLLLYLLVLINQLKGPFQSLGLFRFLFFLRFVFVGHQRLRLIFLQRNLLLEILNLLFYRGCRVIWFFQFLVAILNANLCGNHLLITLDLFFYVLGCILNSNVLRLRLVPFNWRFLFLNWLKLPLTFPYLPRVLEIRKKTIL